MDTHGTIFTWASNILGGGVVIATIIGLIPSVAGVTAVVWYAIQVYESATVQHWLARRRARKLAYLKDQVAKLEKQVPPAVS